MTSRDIAVGGYAVFVVVGCGLQLLARGPGSRIPTIGTTFRHVMRTRSGRVGVIAGWAWLGLHFFAR